MTTWDEQIFTIDTNADFLDEISDLDTDEIVEAVRDAAATIAASWSGAPFSAGDVAEAYPFIRLRPDEIDEKLVEAAAAVLEAVETEADLEQFLEALA